MRLLNTASLQPEEFVSTEGVKYAILSHRWEHQEVSLQQLVAGDVHGKLGHVKIQRFCRLAAEIGYQHAWVDTCCIDKTSSAELQEAINSMYRWYQEAALCYVYLSDVKSVEDLGKSAWFTRGWTLQEMIVCYHLFLGGPRILTLTAMFFKAPDHATFYNCRWEPMGGKRIWRTSFRRSEVFQLAFSKVFRMTVQHVDHLNLRIGASHKNVLGV
jgi:hypothetical protein